MEPNVTYLVTNSSFSAMAIPLSHTEPFLSTAFLVKGTNNAHVLYFGDTGPDAVERKGRLLQLWQQVAQYRATLRAIFIECSFPDGVPDSQLYGHLTPKHLTAELQTLADLVNPATLTGLKIVVTHIKPDLTITGATADLIMQQLEQRNTLGVKYIHAKTGQRLLI